MVGQAMPRANGRAHSSSSKTALVAREVTPIKVIRVPSLSERTAFSLMNVGAASLAG